MDAKYTNIDSFQKATFMIIELQNKNANLKLGLGKIITICDNTKMSNESEVWRQQVAFAKQMLLEN